MGGERGLDAAPASRTVRPERGRAAWAAGPVAGRGWSAVRGVRLQGAVPAVVPGSAAGACRGTPLLPRSRRPVAPTPRARHGPPGAVPRVSGRRRWRSGTGRAASRCGSPPRVRRVPARTGPRGGVQRLQLEAGAALGGERRPSRRQQYGLGLRGVRRREVLAEGEQRGPVGAGGDLRGVRAAARLAEQGGQQALHGEHGGAGGGVVDGETTRPAVASAVHLHHAGGRLDGGLVDGVRVRQDIGPGGVRGGRARRARGFEGRGPGVRSGRLRCQGRAERPQMAGRRRGERRRARDPDGHLFQRSGRADDGRVSRHSSPAADRRLVHTQTREPDGVPRRPTPRPVSRTVGSPSSR